MLYTRLVTFALGMQRPPFLQQQLFGIHISTNVEVQELSFLTMYTDGFRLWRSHWLLAPIIAECVQRKCLLVISDVTENCELINRNWT